MNDNCNANNCPLEPRMVALEAANSQKGETHREIFQRLNELERKSAVQEAQYKAIEDTLEEIKGTVNTMAAKPGKRWDSTTGEIIKFLIQAVLVIAAVKIGLM